jgi:hypothetical protein
MSPRAARRLSAVGAAAAVASVPAPVSAHAIGQVFALPVPLWLYLVGAASAVAASFVVLALVQRRPAAEARYPTRRVPPGVARAASVALAAIGMAWWYGAILAGFTTGDISPLPGVLVWVGIWTALPIVAALFGNPWPSLSPFRTTFDILEAIGIRAGLRRLDAGLAYPGWLGRWPAVALLFVGVWMELVLPGVTVASNVALTLLSYTLVTLVGIGLFGRTAWLTNAELFEVLLRWFGRIGPIGRRTVDAELCAGCGHACDPRRCVDCPECVANAESGDQIVELTSIRRAIANRMALSKREAPHAWSMVEVDVSGLAALRERVKEEFVEREGVKLTYLPFIVKAVIEGLKEHPVLNSVWDGDRIVLRKRINIGVAVDLEEGALIVPVIPDADELNTLGLARKIDEVVRRARNKELSPDDVSGGTFTVNNPGSLGSVVSTPIINYPQAAILSAEAVVKRPVVVDDAIAIRSMMNLEVSFDHRVLDGGAALRFLNAVKRRLEAYGPESDIS